jgi:hypothetical protein
MGKQYNYDEYEWVSPVSQSFPYSVLSFHSVLIQQVLVVVFEVGRDLEHTEVKGERI